MSDELVLYSHPWSRGRTARWMLEEVGVPYRYELLEYGGSMKSPDYLAINPMGKVPTLKHGDVIVTEAAAICAYLADAFPQAGLAPPVGDARRGAYYRWMFFAAGPLESMGTAHALRVEVPDDKRAQVGFGSKEDVARALEIAVSGGDYIVGDRFSAADVYVGGALGWMTRFKILEMRPAYGPYLERIFSRPAYKRAAELDDALAPKS